MVSKKDDIVANPVKGIEQEVNKDVSSSRIDNIQPRADKEESNLSEGEYPTIEVGHELSDSSKLERALRRIAELEETVKGMREEIDRANASNQKNSADIRSCQEVMLFNSVENSSHAYRLSSVRTTRHSVPSQRCVICKADVSVCLEIVDGQATYPIPPYRVIYGINSSGNLCDLYVVHEKCVNESAGRFLE